MNYKFFIIIPATINRFKLFTFLLCLFSFPVNYIQYLFVINTIPLSLSIVSTSLLTSPSREWPFPTLLVFFYSSICLSSFPPWNVCLIPSLFSIFIYCSTNFCYNFFTLFAHWSILAQNMRHNDEILWSFMCNYRQEFKLYRF